MRVVAAMGLGFGLACAGTTAVSAQEAMAELSPEYQFAPDLFGAEVPRGETVRTRQRPELDALGIHAGSFFLFPAITNGITYDDNVFATKNNTKSDFIYKLAPKLDVKSDWNNHSLTLGVGGDFGFYVEETSENYKDVYARAAGSIDVSSSTVVRGGIGFDRGHEGRSDPNQLAGAAEPNVFYTYQGGLDTSHRFNRVTVSVGNNIRYRDYTDTDANGGGTIDNDDRDQLLLQPGARVAYEFSPGYSGFVRGQAEVVRYRQRVDNAGFQRDSRGYDMVVGAAVDLTGLLFGDFFAGVRQRFYEDSRFKTLTGPVVGSTLTWIPTGLTTVKLNIQNQIIEDTTVNSSGYTSTAIGVDVDHELLRNLIVSAGAGFRYDDFEGITRTDKYFGASVGVDYLLNRYFDVGARYIFQKRDSDVNGVEFTNNQVTVSVTAKM